MLRTYKLKNFNFILAFAVVALSFVGFFAIGSAKESLQQRQLYGIIAGIIVMILVSLIDYSIYAYIKWVIYGINIILLLLVLVAGHEANGSKRWINISGFQFQPSELAKILLILFFAAFIMKYKNTLNSITVLFSMILLFAPIFVLIFKEPDLSTTVMITIVFVVMIFVGGLSYKIVLSLLTISIPAGVIFFSLILQEDRVVLKGYQINRILAWLEPEKYPDLAYQQLNSITAISSGQLLGKGLNNNVIASVKNGNFISEPETDFIYAVIGEELGFIGALSVIVLLVIIVSQCLLIAKNSKDDMGAIICGAIASLVSIQGFINIAVTTGFLPNTGIPLPFVSYGLTSLVSLYCGIGVVLNIGLQTTKTH